MLGLGQLRRRDNRDLWLDDSRLFIRDLFEGIAQPFLMIKMDRRNHCDVRLQGIGGVEPAAHARLQNSDVDPGSGKMLQGEGGGNFKEGGMRFPVCDEIANLSQRRRHRVLRNHLATHANALAESDEVRGCEKTGAIFLRAADRIDHGANRPFAVSAGNVNDGRAGQIDMQLVD